VFTGLVEAKGRIEGIRHRGDAAVITIGAPFAHELTRGESVAVNGVCLTVVRASGARFEVEAVGQTLTLTTLGALARGTPVNLERAVKAGDRLGGHIVSGHIDGVVRVTSAERTRKGFEIVLDLPPDLQRYVVERGSIAIDGVSLTVASVAVRAVKVVLITETLDATIADSYRKGTQVNVETDVLAKYQESLGTPTERPNGSATAEAQGLTMERLRELGFLE
jgi:riboflavin synthase